MDAALRLGPLSSHGKTEGFFKQTTDQLNEASVMARTSIWNLRWSSASNLMTSCLGKAFRVTTTSGAEKRSWRTRLGEAGVKRGVLGILTSQHWPQDARDNNVKMVDTLPQRLKATFGGRE